MITLRYAHLINAQENFIIHVSKSFAIYADKDFVGRVSMSTETEQRFESVRGPPVARGFRLRADERWPRRMKIEMNIRPLFGRYDCRIIVVVVTGKRGHRVYASRDDVAEEPRMSQFRAAGVVAPDHRQPGATSGAPSVMYAGWGTGQREKRRGWGEGVRFRDRARIRESPARHCFHHLTYGQSSRRESKNENEMREEQNEMYDNSKDKILLRVTELENKKAWLENLKYYNNRSCLIEILS